MISHFRTERSIVRICGKMEKRPKEGVEKEYTGGRSTLWTGEKAWDRETRDSTRGGHVIARAGLRGEGRDWRGKRFRTEEVT